MDFKAYFEKGLTADEYIALLGENLELHQLHYKKCTMPEETAAAVKGAKPVNIIVLTEPWCGDSLAIFPVVRKIAELNDKWGFKILLRDKNADLMDQFLTRGGRAVPIFLFLSEDFSLLFRWGPRPKATQDIFEAHRQDIQDGVIEKKEVIKKIRNFYSKNRGQAIIAELLAVLREHGVFEVKA